MKPTSRLALLITILFVTSYLGLAQQVDTSVLDRFISSQAAKQKGEEPEGIRKVLTGDLNHDGVADTAVLYTIEGQNGTNNYVQYLAVFRSVSGKLIYATHTAVGGKNRRAIELIAIRDNLVYLDVTDYAKNDPSCCPTLKRSTRYAFSAGRLKELRRKK